MTGRVKSGRALIRIRLRNPTSSVENEVDAWIDTGFTGELVLPKQAVLSLGLPLGSGAQVVLGDGSTVQLDTHTCLLDWFGEWKEIEVVANAGELPLLGVGLLLRRELKINYPAKTVSLE
jgi:clan AA aspartic protease